MEIIGTTNPFYVILLTWLVKTIVLAFICAFIAWLGIRVLDTLTPHIEERERIGENPVSVGLFIAGFFILMGLVIHGAVTAPTLVGAPAADQAIDFLRRLGLIAASFFISLLIGIAILNIVDRLTPKIPFLSVAQSSLGVGVYVFGYLTFFGLIIHAALTTPL
ncbi:MAG: DUF350 domain-containing protein [Dehalococcoidia bacterium]|nr:MAG: DUF350 domain-containing protein [Dehalococcoidia bacterium]